MDVVKNSLTATGMPPEDLELEITESLLLDERINTKSVFSKLGALGITFAIDDFGTGYSSLSYLKRFTVKTLKIDRVFTRDIPADEQVTRLTLSIIAMAHALNMNVVAEGVETREQLETLRENACDYVQGFYFSLPLRVEECEEFLRGQELQVKSKNLVS